jgi:hypothetical protein
VPYRAVYSAVRSSYARRILFYEPAMVHRAPAGGHVCRRVLASADRLLRREGTRERDLDAVLDTYSIGVERLMKLALGTAAVSRGEGWPAFMGYTRERWAKLSTRWMLDCAICTERQLPPEAGSTSACLRSGSALDDYPVWSAAV